MKQAKKPLGWILWILRDLLILCSVLLLVLVLMGTWMISTQTGLHLLVRIAQQIPTEHGRIHVQSASGRLINRVVLHQVQYQSNKHPYQASIKTMVIQMNLPALWSGHLPIKQLTVQQLHLKLPHHQLMTIPTLKAQVIGDSLHIDQTPVIQAVGQLMLSAQIHGVLHAPEHTWKIQLTARHVNPMVIDADYPQGDINATLMAHGNAQKIELTLNHLSGQLHQQPLTGQAHITIDTTTEAKQYHWSAMLQAGKALIKTQGIRENKWDATWRLSVPDFSALLPAIHGQLVSTGRLTGLAGHPDSIMTLKGAHLRGFNGAIARVSMQSHIDFAPHGIFQTILKSQGLSYKQHELKQLVIKSTGEINQHRIQLALSSDENQLDAMMQGKITQKHWIGQLKEFTLAPTSKLSTSPPWQLQAPVDLTLSSTAATLAPLTWQAHQNKLTTQAQWKKNQGWIASLRVNHLNLAALSGLLPRYSAVQEIKGNLAGHLTLKHRVKSNKTQGEGQLILSHGQAIVPKLHLHIHHMQASIQSAAETITYHGQAQSGQGVIHITGTTPLNQPDMSTKLTIKGQHVLLSNQPTLILIASPSLQITLLPWQKVLHLTGQIDIPEALIQPHDFTQTTTLPPDVIFVEKHNKQTIAIKKTRPLQTYLHVKLILGKKIHAQIKGVKGQLTGHLTIDSQPHHPMRATGHLRVIDGSYVAYGQTLNVDHGSLSFINSPLNNPSLNIQASRKIMRADANLLAQQDAMVVGIRIHGSLKQPSTKLFSTPANQSQADILSLLLFGQRSGDLDKNNAALLLQAASILDFGGHHGGLGALTNRLRQSLGLSELGVQSETLTDDDHVEKQNAAVFLGKYLTPRLYIRYSHGILEPTDSLKVRYQINQHLTIQSKSNHEGNGVDLLYTLER